MNKTDCTSPPRTGLEFERRSEGGIQKLVGEGMKFTRKKKAIQTQAAPVLVFQIQVCITLIIVCPRSICLYE